MELGKPFAHKFHWFVSNGYEPHYWQTLFHTFRNDEKVLRFRHLVAGRRGGKTLSAAWEVAYYALHPRFFHWDVHHTESEKALWIWCLAKDHVVGGASRRAFREVLTQCGLRHGKDYTENKTNKYFEFPDGTMVEFRSADEPESLRGAGLDILWIDEAAFIPNRDAYDVVRPALSDKRGIVVSTTTPDGKNWFYDEFFDGDALSDPSEGRVEYRSIDNPYFPAEEWEEARKRYHPLLFKREYMAAFDAMAGKELSGDWLHYYTEADLKRAGKLELYVGVDPAISLAGNADHFAMALIGIPEDHSRVFLIETFMHRLPFAEQIEKIQDWHLGKRPYLIGVEDNAYQAALVQQLQRLSSMPPVIPQRSKGKKQERLLAMGPLFRSKRVLISKQQKDFIDQWIDYDPSLKAPRDDLLDAVEIALRTAGVLLPETFDPEPIYPQDRPARDIHEEAWRMLPDGEYARENQGVSEFLGGDW